MTTPTVGKGHIDPILEGGREVDDEEEATSDEEKDPIVGWITYEYG